VVGRYDTIGTPERGDQVPKQITPCRLAMKTQYNLRIGGPFIDEMHAKTRRVGESRRVRKRLVKRVGGSGHEIFPLEEEAAVLGQNSWF
jgi:hypothetical protein